MAMPFLILPVNEHDHIQGVLNAPITLIEYGDYQCPLCKIATPIVKQLQNELGTQLCFVFRNFPLKQSHPYALMAAESAEAAGLQNKFWDMHNLLYAKQLQFSPEIWPEFAKELELDMEKFKTDLQSPLISQKIQTDFNAGVRSGVNGIPCFYINGKRYDGDPSYDAFKQALFKASEL